MKITLSSLLLCVVVLEETWIIYISARLVCPAISIKNGKVRRRRERARFVTFACNTGYVLAGEKHSTCVHGKWDPPAPKCIRATCMNSVLPPGNGSIYPSHGGAALHFFCKADFELRGPQHVFCDGNKWDNNAPICLRRNTKPPLSCDFEDENLCGWSHDLNHDFDWKRENFNTPSGSIGTGPSWDHTKGAGKDGYYMYIESSSRNENDTARLISPIYDKPNGEICLEFFYHMFGATTGTLRVYLKRNNQSWNLNANDAIFTLSGNQGDHWYRSFHALGHVDQDFQVVIEGVRGPGYVSDIAVDDVSILENCTGEQMAVTTEETYTDDTSLIPIVDSCLKRCGLKENQTSNSYHLTCDCDDDCFDNNRCCPDFYDYCTSGTMSSMESTTTDISNDINQNIITKKQVQHITEQATSPKPTLKSTKATTRRSTSPSTTITTSTTPKATTVTIPWRRPTIIFKRPPTTGKIIFRTPSTITSTTTTTVKTTLLRTNKTQKPGKEIENDVVELPKPVNFDEGLILISSPIPPDDYISKEYWSEEDITNDDKEQYFRHINESTPLFSMKAPKQGGYNVLMVIIGSVVVIVLLSIIAFVVVRRFRDPRNRISFGSGSTSQSDVRFLSHDEMIDFTLPKGYENL